MRGWLEIRAFLRRKEPFDLPRQLGTICFIAPSREGRRAERTLTIEVACLLLGLLGSFAFEEQLGIEFRNKLLDFVRHEKFAEPPEIEAADFLE